MIFANFLADPGIPWPELWSFGRDRTCLVELSPASLMLFNGLLQELAGGAGGRD